MRLIDADALIAIMVDQKEPEFSGNSRSRYMQWLLDYWTIKNAPTIELPSAEPERKKGKWKPFDRSWGRSVWTCTACGESLEVPCDWASNIPIYNYCPNCGADMRGDTNDQG